MAASVGSKRGATSPITTAAAVQAAKLAAFKKNTLAYKKVIDQQQKAAKAASLNKSIQFLQNQITGPNGYRANYTKNQGYLAYDTNMIATGQWGTDPNYNLIIFTNYAGVTYNPTAGLALTTADKTAIYADIVAVNAALDAALNNIAQNNALIDADTKTIGTSVASRVIVGNSGSGYSATNTPPPSKAVRIKATQSQATNTVTPPEFPDASYKWNLPPHAWSLPVDPAIMNPDISSYRPDNYHSTRRGRIWFYFGYTGPVNQVNAAEVSTTGVHVPGANQPPSANHYGFQFLWNPETYSQSTAVNMQVTPSSADPGINLTGFAAANSQISFTLRLDRTNDFACAGASFSPNLDGLDNAHDHTNQVAQNAYKNPSAFTKFYTVGNAPYSVFSEAETSKKISELMKFGTEADLEYLYRVVNGDGWTGIGRNTANIGYLMPAYIRIDLGQNKFVGVVSAVSVNHLAFTRDMIPIRSDVSLTIDLRANIMATTNNTGSSAKTK